MTVSSPRYRILSSLGKGGMGEVFLADDTQLERKVALKFLSDRRHGDPVARARFEREAKSAAALDHPFICKIYEVAEVDGRACIVMEHVAGQTLEATLDAGRLSPAQAIQIAAEMAEALVEAHSRRILHRDLKPANLMLTEQGHVKVMDFGLAKRMRDPGGSDSEDLTPGSLTRTGALLGTPAYMSPEQVRGEPADARSDIFSFGVVLFELLTGEHPFKRGTLSETVAAILRDAPTRAEGNGDRIDYAIFDKLLAKTPADRYQSFEEVSVEVCRLRDATSGWTAPLSELADTSETPLGGRRTPFVGRDSELAELGRWLDQAVRGRGGLVLIGGEPGVGKTRLVEQLLELARERRCLALTGRCYEIEGTPPFIPFVEIIEQYTGVVSPKVLRETLGDAAPEVARLVPELRRLFPDIPPPLGLPPEQQRHYLFRNVAEFLERVSRASSTVLLLDDLQWADNASLLLLQHLAPLLRRLPVLALGTYRDVELDVNRPFAATLETLNRKRLAQRLHLKRLPESGVASMLAALGGPSPPAALVAGIYRETEGNPFFVEEVFQHLHEEGSLLGDDGSWRSDLELEDLDVSEGVRLVIGRRLERVSADSRKVLTFGAVVGRGFSLDLLEAIGDVTGDALLTALEEAEANYLITPMAGRAPRWEFSHALIRQTLAAGLSLPRRQRLHLKVADAIERAAGANAEQHASDLAHHLFQAGTAADPARTTRFLALAGDRALASGAFDEALRHFDDALSLQDEDDPRHVADLRYKKGRALRSLGLGDEALEEWRAALAAYEDLGDGEGIARTVFDAGWDLAWRGRMREAQTLSRRGLDRLGERQDATRCRLLAALASFVAGAGDNYHVSHDLITEAEGLGDTLEHPELAAELGQARVFVHYAYMQLPDLVEVGQRTVPQRQERGELFEVCQLSWEMLFAHLLLGQYRELLDLAEGLETMSARVGHVSATWTAHLARTYHGLLITENLSAVEAAAGRDIGFAEEAGSPFVGFSYLTRGLSRFFAGDWAAAQADLETTRLHPNTFWADMFTSFLVLTRVYDGDREVLDSLQAQRSRLAGIGAENPFGVWEELASVVESLAVLDRPEGVLELYPHVARGIEKGVVITFQLRLWQMVAGIAASCGKQWEIAEEHFETALGQAQELPHKIAQPEVRRWYAQMLLDRTAPGDRDKARTMLGEAVEMYGAIGMPRHLEMAKELLKTAL